MAVWLRLAGARSVHVPSPLSVQLSESKKLFRQREVQYFSRVPATSSSRESLSSSNFRGKSFLHKLLEGLHKG